MEQLLVHAEKHAAFHTQSVKLREGGDLSEATYWQRRQRGEFQKRANDLQIAAAQIPGYDSEEVYEGQFLAPIGENDLLTPEMPSLQSGRP